jgi:hypothetical protein
MAIRLAGSIPGGVALAPELIRVERRRGVALSMVVLPPGVAGLAGTAVAAIIVKIVEVAPVGGAAAARPVPVVSI